MIPDLIYCADGNKRFADIAIKHGFTYGAQLPNTVYHAPAFVDQNWRNPDRAKYMAALAQYRPALATVLDLESESQLEEVLSWADEAAQYVSQAVIIIPKVSGIITALPREVRGKPVRLGYSVPTSFAGTCVPVWEFSGWGVHLLGGSPQRQMELARYMDVRSVDGNYAQKLALRYGMYFARWSVGKSREWPQLQEVGLGTNDNVPYISFELSCINIMAAWRGVTVGLRFASEADIDGIKRIANQYKQQLGFVHKGALKEAIARREVYIAESPAGVVGFVHWHARKDGWQTVYEIAVHKDHLGRRIGWALLNAVPRPTRLKVTKDNARAIAFYECAGMQIVKSENGRKRELWVMERQR